MAHLIKATQEAGNFIVAVIKGDSDSGTKSLAKFCVAVSPLGLVGSFGAYKAIDRLGQEAGEVAASKVESTLRHLDMHGAADFTKEASGTVDNLAADMTIASARQVDLDDAQDLVEGTNDNISQMYQDVQSEGYLGALSSEIKEIAEDFSDSVEQVVSAVSEGSEGIVEFLTDLFA